MNIENEIHNAVAGRLGVTDTNIVQLTESRSRLADSQGVWFGLNVRLPGDTTWTFIGRRRTKADLLQMVFTMEPQNINGMRFIDRRE